MSFSETTKRELARIIPDNHCCRLAELSAFYDFNGYLMGQGRYLDINHSSPTVARKIANLVKGLFPDVHTQILVQRARLRKNQVCTVRVLTQKYAEQVHSAFQNQLYVDNTSKVLLNRCCQRAYLRGAFLSHGSVTNPERTYHLEIFTEKTEVAKKVLATMHALRLEAKITTRKANQLIYLKDSDLIVTFLNIVGAHNALLKFENTRVLKEMRNDVNRLVNCETANVDKTIQAAIVQIEAIKQIQARMPLSDLPPKLSEMAKLRIENPYASLKELGEMANPEISKSGVNYRLRQLMKISQLKG